MVQEIIEQAEEEVGYKPPKYAFDLQIMMLPDEGLVLVFSEKEPLENKNGAQLLQALQEMKRVFEEKKAEIGATLEKQAKEETENNAGKNKKAKGKAEEAAKPQFAIFAFRNIGRVIEYAAVLPATCGSTARCTGWKTAPAMSMCRRAVRPTSATAEPASRLWNSQRCMPQTSRR